MKKKKQTNLKANREDKPLTLGDMLDQKLKSQLKVKQQELQEAEAKQKQAQKEAEAKKRREAQRQREKNMSFEELLANSDMDWEKFK